MAGNFVRVIADASGGLNVVSTTHTVAAGDSVIVIVYGGNPTTCSDGTNSYNLDHQYNDGNVGMVSYFSNFYPTGFPTTNITINGAAAATIIAIEFSGLFSSSPSDKTVDGATGSGTANPSSGNTATLSQAAEIVIAATPYYSVNNAVPAYTADGAYTTIAPIGTDGSFQWNGSVLFGVAVEWKAVNATTAVSAAPTLTIGGADATAYTSVVTYKAASVPGAPTGVSATVGDGQAFVAFTAPASNGNSTILSYTATSTPGSLTGTLTQSGSGTIIVNGLVDGTSYTFTVHATNTAGNSSESSASGSVIPAGPFPLLGPLPPTLRPTKRFIGPYPLADVITWLPPGPPNVWEIISAQPLGALPQTHRIRTLPFIGPFPLRDVAELFPPGPPLVREIVSAQPLGALSQAHRIRRTPWVQTYPLRDAAIVPLLIGLPAVTSVSPGSGPDVGGTTVTILGSGFTYATQVYFGGFQSSSFFIHTDGWIDALSPAGVAGTVNIAVVTPAGTSPAVPADRFTYFIVPPSPALALLGPIARALPRIARFLAPTRVPDAAALLALAPQPRIPEALLAAQRAATSQPVITAVLRAKRGSAARLDPTTLYVAGFTDVACAVAVPANGNIVRAHLSGGNVQVQSTVSAFTTWTTLAAATVPAAGLGVALCAKGDTVVVAYVKSTDNTTARIQISANDGATWGAATDVANTGVITDLAVAIAPNGDLLLVTGDSGGTIRAFRNFGAAVTLVPPGAAFISSIALAYAPATGAGDFYALFGWQTGDLALIGSAIFGNGGLQTANTWSAVTDVLGLDPGSGNTPNVTGFAWGSDGGHAILVETWAVLGGYNATNAYAMECSGAAAFAGGYWTEPAPFPYTSADSSTVFGPDLCVDQGATSIYVAAAENLVAILAPPADVDVSARVIAVESLSEYHAGHTLLILDNSDGAYTSLATNRGTLGLRLDLSLGYQTIDGPLTLPQPARWVVKAESSWVAGRHLVSLTCHDGWQLLHQLTTRRQAQFGTTLGLPTLSVDQLLHWLCAKAGIDYTAAAATALNARTPNWTAYPGRTLGTLVLDLLDTIEGFLLMTDSGATVIGLSTNDPIVYTYGGLGEHIAMQVFHTIEMQAANLVTIYNGPQGQAIAGQAFDPTDAHLLGNLAHEHSDTQLGTGSDSAVAPLTLAADTAAAILRKSQVSAPLHSVIAPPQVGQLLGDVVLLVDPLTGTQFAGRVQSIALHYDRDKGLWQHTIGLSSD